MKDLFKLYQNLKSLTKAESDLIEEGDFDNLKEKLEEKNSLISEIDKIEPKDYFAHLAFSLSREELQKKRDALYQLMQEISKLQSQNMQALEKKKNANKEKMISLYSREKSIKGYLNSDKYEAKFFDEKS
ncbi:FlgN protein [Halanaerobium saccharolyticum]|uniref:FlgN protein n=1 Tax=Halanaerobium saccharolyticum TaxID=43595 RepID=A0A4R6M1L0_9FIRM|nr:flagellar export chaperone FlgN [Halanaerobium saccharolyticum]TDO94445.1 FlgN protein [Halanaerobium saccharolyticum]